MKKIKVVNEAVAPIIAIVLIAVAVIVIVAVMFMSSGASGKEYWQTDVEGFGEIREYIEVEYEDGEIQQLKILVDSKGKPFATVTYDGNAISKFRYILTAVATGTGYSEVEVEPDNMEIGAHIKNSAGTNKWNKYWTTSSNIVKDLDVEFTIFTCEIPIKDQADSHASWSGDWRCEYDGGGDLNYRGLGGTTGNWQTINVMAFKQFNVVITQDEPTASIILDVDQSYDSLW